MSKRSLAIFGGSMALFALMAFINDLGFFLPSAFVMCLLAVGLYIMFYLESKNVVNLPGLLSLFWLGGIGIADMKLSELSANHWSLRVWISVLGFYICFVLVYTLLGKRFATTKPKQPKEKKQAKEKRITKSLETDRVQKRLFVCIVGTTIVTAIAFLVEVVICGFVPALVINMPHAYSYFHVSGVHYFTVSASFVHPLTLLYCYWGHIRPKDIDFKNRTTWILVVCNLVALLIPVLCVSRYFLIMAVALTIVTFLSMIRTMSFQKMSLLVGGGVFLLIPAYILLTVLRGHDVAYLNSIFEMKNPNTPIFITQPYMYIANNYENFNALVRQLPEFVYGRRELYPLFALTGLKFVFPEVLVGFIYYTKVELTTLTIIYDAYYDFGIIGVLVFGSLLGAASAVITERTNQNRNPIAYLFYAQIAMYMVLSFFTTWFSNPTTWFWLILTGMMYIFVEIKWNIKN